MKKRLVLTFILLIFGAFALTSCASHAAFSKDLDQLEPEYDGQIAYGQYGNVMFRDQMLSLDKILKKESQTAELGGIVVIYNNRIWFAFTELKDDAQMWCLASVDTIGTDYIMHYSGEFRQHEDSKPFRMDNRYVQDYFSKQSCYYHDGKIVLSDRVKLVEYDIATGQILTYRAENYTHPEVSYDVQIADFSIVTISSQMKERVITRENAASKSPAFKRLLELSDQKIWDESSAQQYLLNSVFFDGESLYIICRVLDYWGGTHIAAFHYDVDADSLQYCFHHYNNDVVSDGFFLVPVVAQ